MDVDQEHGAKLLVNDFCQNFCDQILPRKLAKALKHQWLEDVFFF